MTQRESHCNHHQGISMPVPEPAAPPFPQACHGPFDRRAEYIGRSPDPSITITVKEPTPDKEPDPEATLSDEECSSDDSFSEDFREEDISSRASVTFFQGASNVIITGNPTFTVKRGDHAGSWSRTRPLKTFNRHGVNVTGSFGNDWPFGPNNNPFQSQTRNNGPERAHTVERQSPLGPTGNLGPNTGNNPGPWQSHRGGNGTWRPPTERPAPPGRTGVFTTSTADNEKTDSSNSRGYTSNRPDNNAASSSSSTADIPNPFAPYGGDSFGNGASNFVIDGGVFMSVRGDPVQVGNSGVRIRPLRDEDTVNWN